MLIETFKRISDEFYKEKLELDEKYQELKNKYEEFFEAHMYCNKECIALIAENSLLKEQIRNIKNVVVK